VRIYRDLVCTHPDAHRPNLAASLKVLSKLLADVDQTADALDIQEECLGQY
jgi:hypothetical protein